MTPYIKQSLWSINILIHTSVDRLTIDAVSIIININTNRYEIDF